MFYFISRIVNSINWRLKTFKKKVLRWFPPKLVRFEANGIRLNLVNTGDYHFTDSLMLNPGVWEKNELLLFSILSAQAGVVFDIGANIGVYAVLAAKANPAARVYAFEPYSTNYEKILANIETNNCSNISPLMLAVGDQKDLITFNVPKNSAIATDVASTNAAFTGAYKDFSEIEEIQVEQTTIDDFVKNENLERVDLIKMDVEYYEMHVLRGSAETIRKFKPAVMCEISIYEVLAFHTPSLKGKIDPEFSEQLQNFFKSAGYQIYALGEYGIMQTETVFGHPDNKNFLFSAFRTDERFVPYSETETLRKLLPS